MPCNIRTIPNCRENARNRFSAAHQCPCVTAGLCYRRPAAKHGNHCRKPKKALQTACFPPVSSIGSRYGRIAFPDVRFHRFFGVCKLVLVLHTRRMHLTSLSRGALRNFDGAPVPHRPRTIGGVDKDGKTRRESWMLAEEKTAALTRHRIQTARRFLIGRPGVRASAAETIPCASTP